MINKSEITIHPLSSLGAVGELLDGAGPLYFYKKRLCRSPFPEYQETFNKVVTLPYVQSVSKTDETLNWEGKTLPVYEHKLYNHIVRIDEVPHSRRKDFIKTICSMNAEAVQQGIVCTDIHENNVFDTIDGIKWIDLGAFKPLTQGNLNAAYLYTCALVHWHILHTHSPEKRDFNTYFTIDSISKGPIGETVGLDYSKPESWKELGEKVGKLSVGLGITEWTNYPDKMIALDNPTHSIKSKIIWELSRDMTDVRTVTDIGCHIGYYTFMAAKYCDSAIGIDIDETCVARAIKYSSDLKLPAIFSNQTVDRLMKNKFNLFNRYKSDMVMALAIIHHLHKNNKETTPSMFVDLLKSLSKKYILIENITLEDLAVYDKVFASKNIKLIKRYDITPDDRKLSLYKV